MSAITRIMQLALAAPNTPITNTRGVVHFANKDLVIWDENWAVPNVEDPSTPGVDGSYIPASVSVTVPTATLNVTLAPSKDDNNVAFQLVGDLRGYAIASGSPCYVGRTNAVTLSSKHPGIPWGHAGDVEWILIHSTTKAKYKLNKTRIEIYGLSSSLPTFLKNPAVPVKFLRYVALPEPKTDYRHWVATTCMTDFWFRYDTFNGRARFAQLRTGGSYRFKYWLDTMFSRLTVNCYDQAGIVQLANCLKEGNPSNTWAYMRVYGYINKTQLVGQGQSNNPFNQERLAIRCIDQLDSRRESFDNHSFIILNGRVMDACCGPHTGTEDLSAYVSNAIDPNPPITASRTTTMSQGITSVTNTSSYAAILPDHIMETVNQIMAKGLVSAAPETRFSNANWDDLPPLLADRFSLQQMQRSTDIGDFGSEINYIFRYDGGALCTLEVRICADHDAAVQAMKQHLGTYQRSLDRVFSSPLPGTEKGQMNLEGQNLSIWVRGDTFLILDTQVDSSGLDIKRVAKTIDEFVEHSSEPRREQTLTPRLSHLPEMAGPVALGSEFTISPSVRSPHPCILHGFC